MSFIRPELAARFRRHRESLLWAGLCALGLWCLWQGIAWVAPLGLVAGVILLCAGAGLLRDSLRRDRLRTDVAEEGVVVIDEARIGYLAPRGGGFIDLPSILAVEMISRPHLPPASGHCWLISAEDGTRLAIPLGAEGAEALLDALGALPGIDFDAGVAALESGRASRVLLWTRADTARGRLARR